MPQLDVSTYSSQLFWLFVCFSILYLYVSMVTVPRIEVLLELRWQNVEGNQLRADEFKKDVENLRQEYEETLQGARQHASYSTLNSLQEMSLDTAHRKKDIADEVLSRIKTAEASIDEKKRAADQELSQAAQEMTHTIIERLLHEKSSDLVVSKAVGVTLQERGL
ncbi:MAG: hypothetical protein ABFQ95_00090 [Pseudomonadota bacterium]